MAPCLAAAFTCGDVVQRQVPRGLVRWPPWVHTAEVTGDAARHWLGVTFDTSCKGGKLGSGKVPLGTQADFVELVVYRRLSHQPGKNRKQATTTAKAA